MSFQGAITDMDAAKARAEDAKARRRLRIQHIRRLERVLDTVENHNLQRDRQVPPDMWRQLAELEVVLPVPAPAALWQARNTARLHDALLDWEADLLDEVAPHRVAYDDTHDD
ncbi:MAG: hypothetical protein WAL84_03980 [Candidatus Dormiibacterota bacterium]|jgi:hypothetical protein